MAVFGGKCRAARPETPDGAGAGRPHRCHRVYKIDRLTRSLTDFAKLAETFEANSVSFVSVTQQSNTTSSMGRLVLNVLSSFAQFEREFTGERIRDKIAASKKKGMWMGGVPPIGYDIIDRHLVINSQQAETVPALMRRLSSEGITTPERVSTKGNAYGGRLFAEGDLYKRLSNPIYIGRVPRKDVSHLGMHEAIIARCRGRDPVAPLTTPRAIESIGRRGTERLLEGRR
jgi:resolvase-like protein